MTNNDIEIPNSTITRDTREISLPTENLYESVAIISKRANQISSSLKEELVAKLDEFASDHDNLEEIFENREQIEISKDLLIEGCAIADLLHMTPYYWSAKPQQQDYLKSLQRLETPAHFIIRVYQNSP